MVVIAGNMLGVPSDTILNFSSQPSLIGSLFPHALSPEHAVQVDVSYLSGHSQCLFYYMRDSWESKDNRAMRSLCNTVRLSNDPWWSRWLCTWGPLHSQAKPRQFQRVEKRVSRLPLKPEWKPTQIYHSRIDILATEANSLSKIWNSFGLCRTRMWMQRWVWVVSCWFNTGTDLLTVALSSPETINSGPTTTIRVWYRWGQP